jgi:hypothetical protein
LYKSGLFRLLGYKFSFLFFFAVFLTLLWYLALIIAQFRKYPIAEPLQDPEAFSHFYLDSWPTLAWDCGFDVDPESLYFRATGKSLWDTKVS